MQKFYKNYIRSTAFFCATIGSAMVLDNKDAAAEGFRISVEALGGVTGARSAGSALATGVEVDRKFGYGFGALVEIPAVESIGLEVGALYIQRTFKLGNSTLGITRTVPTVLVPLEARLWIGDTFSVAGGGFVALRVGSQTDTVTSGSDSLLTFTSGSRKTLEYGLTVATTINAGYIDKTGIFIEARYNRGLTNAFQNSSFEERIDDFLLGAGARFDF